MKKVLILGGGFAGVQTAIVLQKSKLFDVTLISDRDYLFMFPISIWLPVHGNKFDDVKVSLAKIQTKYPFNLVIDRVTMIQASNHQVICENRIISYDYLVVAIGADKMQHKGLNNTLTICG
ncbi:MAG: FAD-dependent oxidoreductase [Paludibacter sp.]